MAFTPGAKNTCILRIDADCQLEVRHKFGRKRQKISYANCYIKWESQKFFYVSSANGKKCSIENLMFISL